MQKMTLHAIIIGEKAKEALHYVDSVQAIKGKGLEGDRYFYGQGTFNKPQLSQDVREVSILPYESLAECNSRLESDLDFLDLRRNLIIKNFDASLLEDKIFTIGTAKFRIVRTCPPCRYLSRLLDKDMMRGLKHIGGYRAVIEESGILTQNDIIKY
ncbi:MOSC domain-containing protein [Sulfurovum sp. XGS-02]|uniref:MOSC domain-containing protein n=1 Tax=Sulfurovum sp. XGS-02 TaxID=2925411 RepID=UPI0020165C51|nr:MOSC domain-containing protein [Sulfurovum sp. XGS-02]UPT78462.1 MOSC domain-containing protein [Sulfurovum sp. XGS-02]